MLRFEDIVAGPECVPPEKARSSFELVAISGGIRLSSTIEKASTLAFFGVGTTPRTSRAGHAHKETVKEPAISSHSEVMALAG